MYGDGKRAQGTHDLVRGIGCKFDFLAVSCVRQVMPAFLLLFICYFFLV
jgi:hypothetical protein